MKLLSYTNEWETVGTHSDSLVQRIMEALGAAEPWRLEGQRGIQDRPDSRCLEGKGKRALDTWVPSSVIPSPKC